MLLWNIFVLTEQLYLVAVGSIL